MKKFLKTTLLLALSLIFVLSGCFGSGGGNSSDNGGSTGGGNNPVDSSSGGGNNPVDSSSGGDVVDEPDDPNSIHKDVTDNERHLVSADKQLHRVNATPSNKEFVKNAQSEYLIVLGSQTSAAKKAANFLSNQVGAATGAYLTVVDAENISDWDETKKYILIACDEFESQANITWATETEDIDLGYSGYMIKSVGNSVFMKVNSEYGYQMVVLSFLREVLGYEWFGDDTISYSKSGETLPDLDIVEKPDFDLTYSSSSWASASKYGSGLTDVDVFVSTDGINFHNSYTFLPPETYHDEHPDWYSDSWGNYHDGYRPGQLCYTAHGNKEEYNAMVKLVVEKMLVYLAQNTTSTTITFTQQDTAAVCACDYCTAATDAFRSITSTIVMFINDVDDMLQEALAAEAEKNNTEKREITLLFFAYQKTVNAPVSGETPEEYALIANPDNKVMLTKDGATEELTLPYKKTYPDGIVCNEHVGCFYANTGARYNHSLYADINVNNAIRAELQKWGMLSDTLYVWTYDTNFYNYLFPYNSYDSIVETARCLKANNAEFYFAQSQDWENSVHPVFGALKRYIVASVRYDVNMNYDDAVDRFFENYFQDAAAPMREYFDKLMTYLEYLEETYPSDFTGSVYDSFVNKAKYWSFGLMNDYLSLCDEAYAAIEKYKTTDSEKYDLLKKHIDIETLFPRFVICENYGGMYTNTEIAEMRQAFCTDCKNLGLTKYAENTSSVMTEYFDKWGVE